MNVKISMLLLSKNCKKIAGLLAACCYMFLCHEGEGQEAGSPPAQISPSSLAPIPQQTLQFGPIQTQESDSGDTFASEFFGNKQVVFSTPFLERYARCSAVTWNILATGISDAEALLHAAGVAMIACSGAMPQNLQKDFAIYAVQIAIVAYGVSNLNSFSEKVVAVREAQAIEYERLNRENALNAAHILTEGHHFQPANTTFTTPFLESYYTNCAVLRNITWDNLGFFTILLKSAAYSIANWSNTAVTERSRSELLLIAMFVGFASIFCEYYVKYLSKNTPKMEQKALEARHINMVRVAHANHAAASSIPHLSVINEEEKV